MSDYAKRLRKLSGEMCQGDPVTAAMLICAAKESEAFRDIVQQLSEDSRLPLGWHLRMRKVLGAGDSERCRESGIGEESSTCATEKALAEKEAYAEETRKLLRDAMSEYHDEVMDRLPGGVHTVGWPEWYEAARAFFFKNPDPVIPAAQPAESGRYTPGTREEPEVGTHQRTSGAEFLPDNVSHSTRKNEGADLVPESTNTESEIGTICGMRVDLGDALVERGGGWVKVHRLSDEAADALVALLNRRYGTGTDCTCHPDDRPATCQKKYALRECLASAGLPDPRDLGHAVGQRRPWQSVYRDYKNLDAIVRGVFPDEWLAVRDELKAVATRVLHAEGANPVLSQVPKQEPTP